MYRLKIFFSRITVYSIFLLVVGGLQTEIPPIVTAGGDTFVNSGQSLGGETGNGVALGDLDGDGDIDAFVANDFGGGEANHVWFNQGNGFFSSGPVLGTFNGNGVALGDLDGDGDLDAIVAGTAPPSQVEVSQDGPGSTQVWLNQGGIQGGNEGSFALGQSFGPFSEYGVAIGDVDNDMVLDVLVVGNSNQVWLNNGNATFTAGPTFPFQFSESAALADLDGDGWLDAVIADSASGPNNRVWWNDGNWVPGPGSFTQGAALPTTSLMQGVAIGNLDADSLPDIFLAGSGPDQIYWNEGARTFSTAGPLSVSDSSWAVALADVDGDNLLDAVVANITAEPNRLWHNDGGRLFTVTQEFGDEFGNYWSRGVGLSDLNGDGSADLFEVTTADDRVWFNQNTPPVIPNEEGWQVQLLDARGDAGYSPSLALDANGYPHISYGRLFQDPDETVTYLTYTRWDGVRWSSEVVGNSVSETSIALDSSGRPHIAYTTGAGNVLRLASWDGAAWQVQDVDDVDFPQTMALGSLVLDANNLPHIIYNTFSNASANPEFLKYARWDGAAWQIQTVETGLVYESALVIDATGSPHISYAFREEFDTYVLKYARWDGAAWQIEILDGQVEDVGVFLTSLTLDAGGSPHIGYVLDDFNSGDLLKYTYWDGIGWQTQTITTIDPDYKIIDISLDADSAGNPHLLYYLSDPPDGGHWIEHSYWDGTLWQTETLDGGEETTLFRDRLVAMVLDPADNLHAAYNEPRYKDLRYVTWAANWQIRTVSETGTIKTPSIAVANNIPSIGYYNQSSGQVKLATWEESWTLNPLDFVSEPVTDLAVAAGPQYEHVSFYDADNERLMYSYWNGATWTMEVVDEAGNVGRYNDLVLAGNTDGGPRIAYWDDTSLRVKLAIPVINSPLWNIYPNNAGPALNSSSGPLSTAVLPGGMGVSYYDGVSGDLRLAVWSAATATWTDERVDGISADAGRLNSLQTDWAEGIPVVAYYDETIDAIKLAYKEAAGWQIETAVSEADGVTSLSLELGFSSRRHARIAYTTNSGTLNVAVLRDGLWEIEVVESGADALSDVSLARDTRLHLAYVQAANGLQYAFRTATLDVNTTNPAVPPDPTTGGYNPLDPCPEDLSPGNRPELFSPAGFIPPFAPPGQGEPLNDLSIFGGMVALFSPSPGGQYYMDLYFEHGSEMGQLGLEDPQLLWDAYGTLQNFLPGLEALVTGQGSEVVVTQEMVDDALNVWQQLAAAGSPGLAATINGELAQYDNLQDFVGLTFDEWVLAIGVNPPGERVYLPVVRRP
jgi:hypothetical protein